MTDPEDAGATPRGRGAVWLAHPFLLAIAPLLNIAMQSEGQFRTGALVELLLAVTLATALLFALVYLASGRRAVLAACIASAIVVAFFYVVPVSRLLTPVSWRLSRPAVVLAGWAMVSAIGLWWLARRREALPRLGRFLTITGAAMVVMNGWPVVRHQLGRRGEIARSPLVRELARPLAPARSASGPATPGPDIFLVVLDQYASHAVLGERFGFDNSAFEDSLRALGFIVPAAVHSNYTQTSLSLASLLNVAHLTPLRREIGVESSDVSIVAHLVENNRVVRFLKRQGYRFHFFPSPWFAPTLENRHADRTHVVSRGHALRRALVRSEMRRAFWTRSLLALLGPIRYPDADHILDSFDGLARAGNARRPTFVLAHVVAPHEPFVLDAECRPLPALVWPGKDSVTTAERDAYIAQLRCVNRLTLALVRTLLERQRPAVIILQGDHGTSTVVSSADEAPTAAELRERFGAFGAYRVPAEIAPAYERPFTVVNALQPLLSGYFGVPLPRLPDEMYFSRYEHPFAFQRVDPAALEEGTADAAGESRPVSPSRSSH